MMERRNIGDITTMNAEIWPKHTRIWMIWRVSKDFIIVGLNGFTFALTELSKVDGLYPLLKIRARPMHVHVEHLPPLQQNTIVILMLGHGLKCGSWTLPKRYDCLTCFTCSLEHAFFFWTAPVWILGMVWNQPCLAGCFKRYVSCCSTYRMVYCEPQKFEVAW